MPEKTNTKTPKNDPKKRVELLEDGLRDIAYYCKRHTGHDYIARIARKLLLGWSNPNH